MRLTPFLFVASATALPTIFRIRALLPEISLPIDYSFGVRVPTSSNPSSSNPLALLVNGYTVKIPLIASSGTLVSWIANYADGKPYNTQFTSINPSAPRNITTDSDSTSQQGGNSVSNATALADGRQARVITTSFSSGNAASAAAAALDGTNSDSTSSSGAANSTAVATTNALGEVFIFTSANTANALNSQSIKNAKGAEAASSCAADSGPAASAQAEQVNSLYIPIGTSSDGKETQWLKSSAYAACAAGVDSPNQGGSSSSGSQSSLTGVKSSVTCNGATSTDQTKSTTYKRVADSKNERNGEATSPSTYRDSSTPLSQGPTSSSVSHDSLKAEPCEPLEVEQGDTGYRGPAANVVASRLPQVEADTMAQRREIEDVYSIRNILNKKRRWDDRMAVLLGETMLANSINRHLGAVEVGYLPEDEHTMGKGTVGTNGHRRMHEFLHSKEKKRKRSIEDIGDEVTDDKSTKRTRTMPRGILKMHTEKKDRHLPRHTG
ncbi:uncharacterized protein J4E79_009015 [Alternaria viburni]|uniref:uncharacterized protein n=1 Tax=Alternaria viburni TaxID=566460 RepID=UPI0020C2FDDA|nr:uncharacterized protein J4E79_009015 [Alternaria viburni]KAI4651535.1 hypothetical protein J4E79_009015 [Alternaria viburni]